MTNKAQKLDVRQLHKVFEQIEASERWMIVTIETVLGELNEAEYNPIVTFSDIADAPFLIEVAKQGFREAFYGEDPEEL